MARFRKYKAPKSILKSHHTRKERTKANQKLAKQRKAHDGCTAKTAYDTKDLAIQAASDSLLKNEHLATIRKGFTPITALGIYLCKKCGLFHLSRKTHYPGITIVSLDPC